MEVKLPKAKCELCKRNILRGEDRFPTCTGSLLCIECEYALRDGRKKRFGKEIELAAKAFNSEQPLSDKFWSLHDRRLQRETK